MTDARGSAEVIERQFSIEDQTNFAALSGDRNPMHVDALAARRLMFGVPVVHGANLVLWALECAMDSPRQIKTVNAQFNQAVRIGQCVQLEVATLTSDKIKLSLSSGGSVVTNMLVTFGPAIATSSTAIHVPDGTSQPRIFTSSEIAHAAGTIPVGLDGRLASSTYPKLFAWDVDFVATIASSSYLVGMECPGLNSIFSSLRLDRRESPPKRTGQMEWKVTSFDERFSRLNISAETDTTKLDIAAFLRPKPTEQPGVADLRTLVTSGEFDDRRALVVGASRGLGEICSKLLAAGGADVYLTYHLGRGDADAVLADILRNGGNATSFQYDALAGPGRELAEHLSHSSITHLYYFATPAIFVGKKNCSISSVPTTSKACPTRSLGSVGRVR
jgi:hypothetical protein